MLSNILPASRSVLPATWLLLASVAGRKGSVMKTMFSAGLLSLLIALPALADRDDRGRDRDRIETVGARSAAPLDLSLALDFQS
jgi:hypothetical protein